MPLFKRRGQGDDPGESSAAGVLNLQETFDRLEDEIFRAERYGRPVVVLCVVAQRIGDEAPPPAETARAANVVAAQLRFSDRIGLLADGTIVVVLPETRADAARVIAHRIAADLTVRSAGANRRNWLVGSSTFPDDGADPPTIVQSALDRAQR